MLGKLLRALERAAFSPDKVHPALVTAVAVSPSILAGLVFFRLPALGMLALAVALAGLVQIGARHARWPIAITPVLPAVIGVAMLGPGAPILLAAAVAVVASLFELIRGRYLAGTRLQVGLLAYAGVLLAAHNLSDQYLNPGSLRPLAEPVALWAAYGGAPIDAVRLYVGNVPGPVFATSLLAVAVGMAWLWYARRLSLAVVAGFAVGAVAIGELMRLNLGYQLDSGPTWFAAGLVLADRRSLPQALALRPLVGLVAGIVAVALRVRGLGIEGTILTIVGIQLAIALVEAGAWLVINRRRVWSALRALNALQLQLNNPLRRARRSIS